MGTQENIQQVKDAYAAFGRGDIPALLAMMADDVEWLIPGEGPLSGTYRGRDGVAGFFQKLAEDTEILNFEPREFIGQADRVVVLGMERTKIKATNRIIELEWAMAFTIRDGKIAKFREYSDTQAIASAYASSARAAG